jgi:endonuclease/exonuclease/phosphatase family metal-dependent hydrolase
VDEIALMSGHAHVAVQENRTIPGISRHGNAILSHRPLANIVDLKLPGRIAGRGCLIADIASERPLRIACLHLSLGLTDQQLQLAAVAEALGGAPAWAAMGDFNCGARSTPLETFCELTGGRLSRIAPLTFPSWRPRQDFDHVVIGGELEVTRYQAEPATFSDHLAISTRLAF